MQAKRGDRGEEERVAAPPPAHVPRDIIAELEANLGALAAAQAVRKLRADTTLRVVAPQLRRAAWVVTARDLLGSDQLSGDADAAAKGARERLASEHLVAVEREPAGHAILYRPAARSDTAGALPSEMPSLPVPPSQIERALREVGFSKTAARRVMALGLFTGPLPVAIGAVERTLVYGLKFSSREARAFMARGLSALRCTPTVPDPAARGPVGQ